MWTCIECDNSYDANTGDVDERICNDCIERIEREDEYSVTVKASYGVMAESQKEAEEYILQQFYNGNANYTGDVEAVNE